MSARHDVQRHEAGRRGPARRAGIVAAVAGALIVASQLVAGDRQGTDDAARQAVQQVAPSYRPWARRLVRETAPDAERALFILQGMIGALVLGTAVWRLGRTGEADA